jgi:hypothetical protein
MAKADTGENEQFLLFSLILLSFPFDKLILHVPLLQLLQQGNLCPVFSNTQSSSPLI